MTSMYPINFFAKQKDDEHQPLAFQTWKTNKIVGWFSSSLPVGYIQFYSFQGYDNFTLLYCQG